MRARARTRARKFTRVRASARAGQRERPFAPSQRTALRAGALAGEANRNRAEAPPLRHGGGRWFRFEGAHKPRPVCRHRCDATRRTMKRYGHEKQLKTCS